ncbi:MAG: aminotransferase class I/II-fold pyridoxal phosphate-dependent enzyme, partial [bacterium]|nr:aminotransferase class I/II-fold pyridoxal phosphate-dependent enzyme [bacterium]
MEFERIERLPPYVLGVVTEMMLQARKKGEDIINLGMGNPDLPTPAPIVAKLLEAATKTKNHRYSVSRGILSLRRAICRWYENRFGISFDPNSEAIATMGAKEGLSHLILALVSPGDVVFVPNPTYPIHRYAPIIAGADVCDIRLDDQTNFFENLEQAIKKVGPKGRVLILSFPSNPTAQVVDLSFFERVVAFAKE